MDAIYEEHGSHWSQQVSAVATTQWLQRDQTLPFSEKGVACETILQLSCKNESEGLLSDYNAGVKQSRSEDDSK